MTFLKMRRSRKILTVLAGILLVMQIHSYYRFRFMISDFIHDDRAKFDGKKNWILAEYIAKSILIPILYSWQVNFSYFIQLTDDVDGFKLMTNIGSRYQNGIVEYTIVTRNPYYTGDKNLLSYDIFQNAERMYYEPRLKGTDAYSMGGNRELSRYVVFDKNICTFSRYVWEMPTCISYLKKDGINYMRYHGSDKLYKAKIVSAKYDRN
jgi:hypothetical protein